MKEYKILLVCSGGMSTSILMNKMKQYAQDNGFEIKIDAVGTGAYEEVAGEYEIICLGPQIAYRRRSIQDTVDIPVISIEPRTYAFADSAKLFEQVDKELGK